MKTVMLLVLLLAGVATTARTQGTVNPHGPNIGTCATCHRADSWRPARISREFRHAERTFPLEGAHERTECTACHRSLDFSKTPTACAQCHRDVHKSELGSDCGRCHTTRSFVDQTNLKRMHELTNFPLRGAHAPLACEACHTAAQPGQSQYLRRPTTCISCHVGTYRQTSAPDHQAAQFPQDCTLCHTMAGWTGGRFDHATTRFALVGAHVTVGCAGCHGDGVFRGKATTCIGCHQADYTWSKTPPHAASGFPTTCLTCHTVTTWKGSTFDHGTSRFPLTGAHRAAVCSGCHADNVFRGKPTACLSCHQRNYNASTRPPHSALAFSTACATCHGTSVWAGAPFDHATTAFPLTGAHRTALCASCHADAVYRGKSAACQSCHQPAFAATRLPPHSQLGFSSACATCHTTTSWSGGTFDHNTSPFQLTGAHRAATCASCHADGVYRGRPSTCVACHQSRYAATTSPSHTAAGYGTTCQQCHGTTSWFGSGFDHAATAFPLTGAHRAATCSSCHANGVYRGRPSTCVACHQANYAATTRPAHAASGFPTTCQQCHGTTAWLGSGFDHSLTTFPLVGAHRTVVCTACHGDGVYRGKSTACASCHQPAYTASVRPPHSQLGFSTVCSTCHTMVAWAGGTFDHNTTRFALAGAHRAVACSGCHADGVYRGKPMLCAACHQARYNAATSPPHAAAGFPTTCEVCHGTTAWTPATFSHSTTRFPLTGAHVTKPCAACHGDGVYRGKPMACVSCHQAVYTATTNPNHAAAHFPATCESCHTTTRWTGATFNHDASFFPIYSGKHKGKWTVCSDCHTVSTNYASFSCFSCHRQTEMDKKHKGRAGYRYESALCYQCHPRGSE